MVKDRKIPTPYSSTYTSLKKKKKGLFFISPMLQLCALGFVGFISLNAAQHLLAKLKMLYPLYLDRFALNYTSHKHYRLLAFKQLAKN